MIIKHINLFFLITLHVAWSANLFAEGLTTLQHFDPSPNFSANDSMMPPNSQFLDLLQARIKHEKPNKKRWFGLNVSGFIQRAVRANGYTGSTQYGSVSGSAPNAYELGDFRGTLYAMGLFLGSNPNNGHNLWLNDIDDGLPSHVTGASIAKFGLPECLEDIAYTLAGYDPTLAGTPTNTTPSATALVFFPPLPTPPTAGTGTSIFSQEYLSLDTIYFGAFSLPIVYQKQGLRWEINANFGEHIGLTIQSGLVNMSQKYVNTLATATTSGQTSIGPYSLSAIANSPSTTPPAVSSLYNNLNLNAASPTAAPNTTAQGVFNNEISNNITTILNKDCTDYSTPLCSFNDYSVEDIRFILSFKHTFEPFRFRHEEDEDLEDDTWPDMLFTPYAWVGGTCPIAKEICYSNILSLPFGNNGHASVGGAIGMTFDFAESVEVGFEGGATYFLARDEYRPFPTHQLQRLIYPFETSVNTSPGMNWQFRALLNAYQFIKHINFWMTYELIEHRQDCFYVNNRSKAEYFVPSVISCRSDWKAQFFNAALSFDIQPGLQASVVWQQPISPRNAYYPVSILGSINFLF